MNAAAIRGSLAALLAALWVAAGALAVLTVEYRIPGVGRLAAVWIRRGLVAAGGPAGFLGIFGAARLAVAWIYDEGGTR